MVSCAEPWTMEKLASQTALPRQGTRAKVFRRVHGRGCALDEEAWPTRWRGGMRLFDLICRSFSRDCGWGRRRDSYTVTIIAPSSRNMIGPI